MSPDPAPARAQMAKVLFAIMALGSVLLGMATYVFAGALGIERDVAVLIAVAFLVAGTVDLILMVNWDRLTRKRGQ